MARLVLSLLKTTMTIYGRGADNLSLITGSQIAFTMWDGVKDRSWSFLSPPGMLRDKGIRTGKYQLHVDKPDTANFEACYNGIYNEDIVVAIVDECENNNLAFTHWSCTGQIDLGRW